MPTEPQMLPCVTCVEATVHVDGRCLKCEQRNAAIAAHHANVEMLRRGRIAAWNERQRKNARDSKIILSLAAIAVVVFLFATETEPGYQLRLWLQHHW